MAEESVNKEKVGFIGTSLCEAMILFLNNGYTPGEITAGLASAIYSMMRTHGMTNMQCSNSMLALSDKFRDLACQEH